MFNHEKQSWLDGVPSKTAFIFGAVSGVGGAAVLALLVMLVSWGGNLTPRAGNAGNNEPTAGNAAPTPSNVPSGNTPVSVDAKTDHILGNNKAPVTIVEFSDFQCPFCERFAPTVKKVVNDYKDKVRLVYKHFPLDSSHPWARPAALASECAAEQGKFWEYHDALFARQDEFSADFWGKLASELKLNTGKFNDCVQSEKYENKVQSDYQQGLAAGARGTPHTVINGTPVSGAVPYEQLKAVIDQALKK
jgi:protein-disulfide isomerase